MDSLITNQEFASVVNLVPCRKRIIWMQQCASGTFAIPLIDEKSFIVTSTYAGELAYRADNLNPDYPDTVENEVVDGVTYHHGEFNYHMMNAAQGKTIVGNIIVPYSPFGVPDINS